MTPKELLLKNLSLREIVAYIEEEAQRIAAERRKAGAEEQ